MQGLPQASEGRLQNGMAMGMAAKTRGEPRGLKKMIEVCAFVFFHSSGQLGQFLRSPRASRARSCINKHKIHAKLRLFSKIAVILGQTCFFKNKSYGKTDYTGERNQK